MLFRVPASQSKSFRLPAAAELLSLCVAKEKVTKEKGHPAWRLLGILPNKSVSRGRAFRQHIRVLAKRNRPPADSRCAACRPRLTAAQGPRVEQRAILTRTIQKSQSNGKQPPRAAGATNRRLPSCQSGRPCHEQAAREPTSGYQALGLTLLRRPPSSSRARGFACTA